MYRLVFRNALKFQLRRHFGRSLYSNARVPSTKYGIKEKAPILFGATAFSVLGLSYIESDTKSGKDPIEGQVCVDSSIDSFSTNLDKKNQVNLHDDFDLLGYGVRSVTFLSFKVYGIGVYISRTGKDKARKILFQRTKDSEDDLLKQLLDPDNSRDIIEALEDAGVKFTARIVPVRNTDFNHLKDGLIKSILAHPESKQQRETIGNGLEELRDVFSGHRGSVPKNHALWLEMLSNGELSISYENTSTSHVTPMGVVKEPLISKVLFLQYLSGKKPLTESLRKSCVDGLVGLV